MNGGRISDELRTKHERMAIALGLSRMDVPRDRGGPGLSVLAQVAATEAIGSVTNALGWCYAEAQSWMFEACNDDQVARYVMPLTTGDIHLCYAITEENAGSDPAAIEATARRDGDHYVINGEKWHVTSHNHANTIVVQAKLESGDHCLFFCPADAPELQSSAARPIRTTTITITPFSPSGTSACRCATVSARKATAWASPMPGSAASA